MKPTEVTKALLVAIKADVPVFIEGSPGGGKSAIVNDIAVMLVKKMFDIRLSQYDSVDLHGIPKEKDGLTMWCPPSTLPREENCIIFLDEITSAPPLVQAAAYQLVFDRKLGDYVVPDNCPIIAAGNKTTDRAVVHRMSTALASRFMKIEFETDVNDWIKWAMKNNITMDTVNFHRWRGHDLLHNFDPKRHEKAFPCPRTWEFVDKIKRQNPPTELELEMYSGLVGEGAANEYVGYLQLVRKFVSPDVILANPSDSPVPDNGDIGTLYAMCGALSARCTEGNFGRIAEYADRMQSEFGAMLIDDCIRRVPECAETQAYVNYSLKHGNSD